MRKSLLLMVLLFGSLNASGKTIKLGINSFPLLTAGRLGVVFEGQLTNELSLGIEHQFPRWPLPEYLKSEKNINETKLLLHIYPQGIYKDGFIISPNITYSTGAIYNSDEHIYNTSGLSTVMRISYSFGNSFIKFDPFVSGGWTITHNLLNKIAVYPQDDDFGGFEPIKEHELPN